MIYVTISCCPSTPTPSLAISLYSELCQSQSALVSDATVPSTNQRPACTHLPPTRPALVRPFVQLTLIKAPKPGPSSAKVTTRQVKHLLWVFVEILQFPRTQEQLHYQYLELFPPNIPRNHHEDCCDRLPLLHPPSCRLRGEFLRQKR